MSDKDLIHLLHSIDPKLAEPLIFHHKVTVRAKPKPRRHKPWPKTN
jgi:hypothetical protein